jgi:HlyD family secretion protein
MEVQMSKGKKIWIACSGIVLLAIIIVAGVKSTRKNAILVQTSVVERKDVLSSKVTASGEIRAKKFVDLQSEVPGIITELHVHEGDSVKRGDILLRIDPIQTDADVEMARANYDQSTAQARAQEIEISNAEVQLMRDEVSLRSARAELEKAESKSCRDVYGKSDPHSPQYHRKDEKLIGSQPGKRKVCSR